MRGEGHAKKKWLWMGAIPKNKLRGGQLEYFSNAMKWHNVLIFKKLLYNKIINIVERKQIFYKLYFPFKITFVDKKLCVATKRNFKLLFKTLIF